MTVPRGENENRGLYGWKRRSSTGRGSAMPAITFTPLLGGLDLSSDAAVLGLKTSPEELEDAMVEAFEADAPRRDRATAPRSLTPRSPPPLHWPGGAGRELRAELQRPTSPPVPNDPGSPCEKFLTSCRHFAVVGLGLAFFLLWRERRSGTTYLPGVAILKTSASSS